MLLLSQDSYRTNSDKFKKINNNTITNNNDDPPKDTAPQPRSSTSFLSMFRTFPSWPSLADSTTTTSTTKPSSLWSRLSSPSQPTLSNRENDRFRKLKGELQRDNEKLEKLREEVKRDKTTRMQSSMSSFSLAAAGGSSVELAEMMNTGGGAAIPSIRQAPVNQRVYVV